MDTLKSMALEPVKKQVEMLAATSPSSNTRKRNADNIKDQKEKAQQAEQKKEPTNEKINRIAEAMDSYVQSMQRDLKIQVHEGTGNIMVRVTSQDGDKIIREIPPKELLDLAARMDELAGTLYDEKV